MSDQFIFSIVAMLCVSLVGMLLCMGRSSVAQWGRQISMAACFVTLVIYMRASERMNDHDVMVIDVLGWLVTGLYVWLQLFRPRFLRDIPIGFVALLHVGLYQGLVSSVIDRPRDMLSSEDWSWRLANAYVPLMLMLVTVRLVHRWMPEILLEAQRSTKRKSGLQSWIEDRFSRDGRRL
jgi:hypothetical protein